MLFGFCAAGEPSPECDWEVDWSPDGTQLGAHCPHLYVLDIAPGEIEDLVPGDDPSAVDPSWSPDGTKIAHHGAPDGFTPRGILVLDLVAGTTTNLTPGEEVHKPAWSSDGEYIAYFSGSTLMTMRSDGSDKAAVGVGLAEVRAT